MSRSDRAAPVLARRPARQLPYRAVAAASLVLALASCASSGPVASSSTTGAATSAPPTSSGSTTVVASAVSCLPLRTAAPAGGLTSVTVPSTVDQYFVLFVKSNAALPLEIPVSITRGKAGSTTLSDGRPHLAKDRYRVATFQVNAPGDVDGDGVDGDGVDDLAEFADPTGKNPLNPIPALGASVGSDIIADRATFEAMSYQGSDVARVAYLAGQEFVKFWIVGTNTDHPAVYFMNTNTYRAHPTFASTVGLPAGRAQGTMRGDVVWDPAAIGPSGKPGVYRFAFQQNDALPFAEIAVAYELLAANMPFVGNNLMYYPFPQAALPLYLSKEKPLYDASRVPVLVAP